MPSKECDPRCTGRCNKNRMRVLNTADKSCDPLCTARCSKRNAGTSPEKYDSSVQKIEEIYPKSSIQKDIVEDAGNAATKESSGKINAVIIDLDGVILDIETVYEWVVEDLVDMYGIPKSEVQRIIDLQDEETASKFCEEYKLSISTEEFMKTFWNISVKNLRNTPLMPGIENLMEHFVTNNIPVASASTSNDGAFKLKTTKHNQFFSKFTHIVLGGSDPEVTARKPSPILYNICGSRFPTQIDPKTILVLEDAPEGVVAAKEAGMNVVWFPNKYMKRDVDGAAAILNSIREFKPQEFGLPPMKG